MRYLLLFLFFRTQLSFAQDTLTETEAYFFDPGPRWDIYDTKWYMNAAQFSYFSWNDTSTLVSSTPYDEKFIVLSDKMEFGTDRSPKDLTENTFVEYRLHFGDYDDYDDSVYVGTIALYKSGRNARRDKKSTGYYEFILTDHQLMLIQNEPANEPFDNLYFTKTIIFSRYRDTLEFTTNLLGNWQPEVIQNMLLASTTDTLEFHKVPATSVYTPGFTYNFNITDGYWYCSSDCFSITSSGYDIRDGVYPTPQYEYMIDIGNRQLIIYNGPYDRIVKQTFDIIELTNNQLKLVRHSN